MVSSLLNGCVPVDFLAAESVGKGRAMAFRWIGVNMPVLGKISSGILVVIRQNKQF